jgi:hypothetical protein
MFAHRHTNCWDLVELVIPYKIFASGMKMLTLEILAPVDRYSVLQHC